MPEKTRNRRRRLVTGNDFRTLNALIAEAFALCAAAQADLERIQDELQKALREGCDVAAEMAASEARARARLAVARARLLRRQKRLDSSPPMARRKDLRDGE